MPRESDEQAEDGIGRCARGADHCRIVSEAIGKRGATGVEVLLRVEDVDRFDSSAHICTDSLCRLEALI